MQKTVVYFPHKFNIDENQHYVEQYPDKSYYGYEEMKKAKDRENRKNH